MLISQLIQLLEREYEKYGDVCILKQLDDEGNGYECISGLFSGVVDAQDVYRPEYIYDDVHEAEKEGVVEFEKVLVIY